MPQFRKKPVVIEAVQWTGSNMQEVSAHFKGSNQLPAVIHGHPVSIATLEGEMRADIGDYIIRGVKGEYYPCKPDIFDATYEPA
jgi:hypothetical protein